MEEVKIRSLFEKDDPLVIFYPKTVVQAVAMLDGTTLYDYLLALEAKCSAGSSGGSSGGTSTTQKPRGILSIIVQYAAFEEGITEIQVRNSGNLFNTSFPEASSKYPVIWKRYKYKYTDNTTDPTWTYEICTSIGKDGDFSGTESIYLKCLENPNISAPESINENGHCPDGWSSFPPTVSAEEESVIYISTRTKLPGKPWGKFSTPVIWGINFGRIRKELNDAQTSAGTAAEDARKAAESALTEGSKAAQEALETLNAWKEEIDKQVNQANENAAIAHDLLDGKDVGELAVAYLNTPDGYATLMGKNTPNGMTFSLALLNYDKFSNFIGEITEGEDDTLEKYLNTQLELTSDRIALNAAKNTYEPYGGVGTNPSLLEKSNIPIPLEITGSYYCVYKPSKTPVQYKSKLGEWTTCETGAFTISSTEELTVSFEQGLLEQIDLYKTLNSSFGQFKVSSEEIEGVLTKRVDKEGGGTTTYLALLVMKDEEISQKLSRFDTDGDDGYIKLSELKTAYNEILALVGSSSYIGVEPEFTISVGETRELGPLDSGKYQLIGGVGKVDFSIKDETSWTPYDGQTIEIEEEYGTLYLKNTSEKMVTLLLITDIIANKISSLTIDEKSIKLAVSEYLKETPDDWMGSLLTLHADEISGIVFNNTGFSSILQTVDEINEVVYGENAKGVASISAAVLNVDSIALRVISGPGANIFGSFDRSIEDMNWSGKIASDSGTKVAGEEDGSVRLENANGEIKLSWPSWAENTSIGIGTPTEMSVTSNTIQLKKATTYVLSWEAESLRDSSVKKIEVIENNGEENGSVICTTTVNTAKFHNKRVFTIFTPYDEPDSEEINEAISVQIKFYFKSDLEISFGMKTLIQPRSGSQNSELIPLGSTTLTRIRIIKYPKLELGLAGNSSLPTTWNLTGDGQQSIAEIAMDAQGIALTVSDLEAQLSSQIKQTADSISLTVSNEIDGKLDSRGLLIDKNGNGLFTGNVAALSFLVEKGTSRLEISVWDDNLLTKYGTLLGEDGITITSGTPVIIAYVIVNGKETAYVLNMTQLRSNEQESSEELSILIEFPTVSVSNIYTYEENLALRSVCKPTGLFTLYTSVNEYPSILKQYSLEVDENKVFTNALVTCYIGLNNKEASPKTVQLLTKVIKGVPSGLTWKNSYSKEALTFEASITGEYTSSTAHTFDRDTSALYMYEIDSNGIKLLTSGDFAVYKVGKHEGGLFKHSGTYVIINTKTNKLVKFHLFMYNTAMNLLNEQLQFAFLWGAFGGSTDVLSEAEFSEDVISSITPKLQRLLSAAATNNSYIPDEWDANKSFLY